MNGNDICGWGRYPVITAEVHAPRVVFSLGDLLRDAAGSSMLARGLGRSYGDSSLNERVIEMRYLDKFIAFNPQTGVLTSQAGASLAELLKVFVPKGWFLPVTPGTRFITLGGAVASDVHGKNHHRSGCFCDHVERIEVMVGPDHIITCSKEHEPELFYATCGGMGLTGIILSVALRLKPVTSAFIDQQTFKARNLAHALDLFEQNGKSTYSVAWIDCVATGKLLGRSLVMTGEHTPDRELASSGKTKLAVPFDMPPGLLNNRSVSLFNTLYYQRVRGDILKRRVHYEPFFYPLDGILQWNRLYGKNGFTQYQFVIPKSAGLRGMSMMLQEIARSGKGSFLAVLKVLGRENRNHLSFPIEGYTLALDFKIEKDLFPLLDRLDAMLLDLGGRVYLTKDVRMSAETFAKSYGKIDLFQSVRERYAVSGVFASHQSRRLGLDS
ncbi:MAG: FAD-binding oxidoreductase [Chlorobiaceae bacterium]|nr:FAD-binding oxidoreductase [Chlorobiaceae bacterium]